MPNFKNTFNSTPQAESMKERSLFISIILEMEPSYRYWEWPLNQFIHSCTIPKLSRTTLKTFETEN